MRNDFVPDNFLIIKVNGKKGTLFKLYVIKALYPEDDEYVLIRNSVGVQKNLEVF